jgi:hypothetical protein
VTLSVFTFASAIARVFDGLDTTTGPARLASTVAIAQVFPVASSATSSAGPRPAANSRTPSGVAVDQPARRPPSTPSTSPSTAASARAGDNNQDQVTPLT